MRKTFFIVNPSAGQGTGLLLLPEILSKWEAAGIPQQVYVTRDHEDILCAAKAAVAGEATDIGIVGGDGTVMAAINGLGSARIPIGIIPCGTGNDFIRSVSTSHSAADAVEALLRADRLREVSLGASDKGLFLNVASIGIDAAIARRAARMKHFLKGPLVYLAASIIEIFRYRPLTVTLSWDGHQECRKVVLVAVANGAYYGGGMHIAPMADPCDTQYDVVLARSMSRLRLLQLLPKLYTGRHIGAPEVETFRCARIRVQCEEPQWINYDGEILAADRLEILASHQKISAYVI